MNCGDLDRFLERNLSDEDRRSFERHLAECGRCRDFAEAWSAVRRTLTRQLEDRIGGAPGQDEVQALVREAADERRRSPRRRPLRAAIAGLAAAAVLVWLLLPSGSERPAGPEVETAPSTPEAMDLAVQGGPAAPANRPETVRATPEAGVVLRRGPARIGLAPDAQVQLTPADDGGTRLRLDRGGVAIDREAGREAARLEIEAPFCRVVVTGTRFWVELRESDVVEVGVERGSVRVVHEAGATWSVPAGRTLRIGRRGEGVEGSLDAGQAERLAGWLGDPPVAIAARPTLAAPSGALAGGWPASPRPAAPDATGLPAGAGRRPGPLDADAAAPPTEPALAAPSPEPPAPSLDEIQRWILDGRTGEAERELEAMLARRPGDASAWSALAACRRRQESHAEAVTALRRVIELAGPIEGNRARFLAGRTLQDQLGDPAAAIPLFEAYLRQGPDAAPLAAEARLRLAKALLAVGRAAEAEPLLRDMVEEHRGEPVGLEAARLLEGHASTPIEEH
ncbi:MAG: tetratricopeptide repeat protein [Deltaproteobacteria bacterium]|nr:tetratricopeptide repeat protein [Deltaproteobacteria bacterium]